MAGVLSVGAEVGVCEAPGLGMISLWPIRMRSGFVIPLALAIAATVLPYLLAIPARVSPGLTTWIAAMMVGAGPGVGEGGRVLVTDGLSTISSVAVGFRVSMGRGGGVRLALGEA